MNDANFYVAIKRQRLTLVAFYAPWCDHCAHLMPELDEAARDLEMDWPSISIVKVNAVENDLVVGYERVEGYPSLKLYRRGKFLETYTGSWDAAGIVKYLRWYNRPAIRELMSEESVRSWLRNANDTVVLGAFITEMDGEFRKFAQDLAGDYKFAHCSTEHLPLDLLDLSTEPDEDVVYAVKSLRYDSEGERPLVVSRSFASNKVLKEFLFRNNLPLVGQLTTLNRDRYFDDADKRPLVVLYFDLEVSSKRTRYLANRIRRFARFVSDDTPSDIGRPPRALKEIARFAYADMHEFRRLVADTTQVAETPSNDEGGEEEMSTLEFFVVMHIAKDRQILYRDLATEVSKRSYGVDLAQLRAWILENLPVAKAHAKSNEAAEIFRSTEWLHSLLRSAGVTGRDESAVRVGGFSNAVVELTPDTFRHVVYHPDAHVFVAIYAEWCPYCHELSETMSALAASFEAYDEVIVARMDGSVHDVPAEFDVGVLPSFFYCKRTAEDSTRKKKKKRRKRVDGDALVPPERFLGLPLVSEMEKFVKGKARIDDKKKKKKKR